ncbi:MAG TPA: hypothetical protein PLO43_01995 [Chlamydiales bacterium]|nr:hypothetical protein [Chlamydiales bacterium]
MALRWSVSSVFSKWWWVVAFLSICYLLYLQSVKEKRVLISSLEERIETLEQEKEAFVQEQEELSLRIDSEQDPAYVEMTLMKELGVVPEGQEKVIFDK